jgi:predicted ATP-dependent protease
MIPHSNVKNLMLSQEVVQAVRKGEFNIYAVRTIAEGIEVITGVPAGRCNRSGVWTEGSVNARVQARLRMLRDALRADGVVTQPDGNI